MSLNSVIILQWWNFYRLRLGFPEGADHKYKSVMMIEGEVSKNEVIYPVVKKDAESIGSKLLLYSCTDWPPLRIRSDNEAGLFSEASHTLVTNIFFSGQILNYQLLMKNLRKICHVSFSEIHRFDWIDLYDNDDDDDTFFSFTKSMKLRLLKIFINLIKERNASWYLWLKNIVCSHLNMIKHSLFWNFFIFSIFF